MYILTNLNLNILYIALYRVTNITNFRMLSEGICYNTSSISREHSRADTSDTNKQSERQLSDNHGVKGGRIWQKCTKYTRCDLTLLVVEVVVLGDGGGTHTQLGPYIRVLWRHLLKSPPSLKVKSPYYIQLHYPHYYTKHYIYTYTNFLITNLIL